MPYVKNNSYCDMPFSAETPNHKGEFYTYWSVDELVTKSEMYKEDLIRCRTVGILQSAHGRFYLTDVSSPVLKSEEPMIRVSMVYLNAPLSPALPYPVQVFGTLQWKNRPVIFAKIMQVLTPPMALRIKDAMSAVNSIHLSRITHEEDNFNEDPM